MSTVRNTMFGVVGTISGIVFTIFLTQTVLAGIISEMDWFADNGLLGYFALVGVFIIMAILFVPGSLSKFMCGHIFGFIPGMLFAWFASMIAAFLSRNKDLLKFVFSRRRATLRVAAVSLMFHSKRMGFLVVEIRIDQLL